jgi:hypothetical protein
MMFILTVIVGFFLMFIGALFTGWIYELVYELAIVPIVTCFNVTAPDIPFMLFVLLSIGITACTYKTSTDKESYTIKDPKFWGKWLGGIVAKLLLILLLWIVNSFVIG